MAKRRRKMKGRPKGGRPPIPGLPNPPPLPGQPLQKKVKRKRKRKIKLSLKSRAINNASDDYQNMVGWTSGGFTESKDTVTEEPKTREPEFIKHQCDLCGSVMQVKKPKRSRYTIICPHCEHEEKYE